MNAALFRRLFFAAPRGLAPKALAISIDPREGTRPTPPGLALKALISIRIIKGRREIGRTTTPKRRAFFVHLQPSMT